MECVIVLNIIKQSKQNIYKFSHEPCFSRPNLKGSGYYVNVRREKDNDGSYICHI